MTKEVTAQATIEIPSSNDSKGAQTEPKAETVIQAAIQTGAAAERTEAAAAEATRAAAESSQNLEAIREAIRSEMQPIHDRLKHLEEMEEEEENDRTTQDEEADTQLTVSAETVTLDEPPKPPVTQETKQQDSPDKTERGGLLRKLLLNS